MQLNINPEAQMKQPVKQQESPAAVAARTNTPSCRLLYCIILVLVGRYYGVI